MASLQHNHAFTAGMIRRLRLTNFLTYRDVELQAGPRHNLVLGPNGTGKSSLLCAIGLGLGGRPKILGRADDLGTFILYGEAQAEIEIAIQEEAPGKMLLIRRHFERSSKRASKFYIRVGSVVELQRQVAIPKSAWKHSNEEEVRTMVKALGVDVDNLSCFMPQERVGEFSGIDPVPLLRNTLGVLQAAPVGAVDYKMADKYDAIITKEQDVANMAMEGSTAARELDKLRGEAEALEHEVERQKERRELEEVVDVHAKLLRWKHFDEVRNHGKAITEELKELESAEEVERAKVEPLQNTVDKLDARRAVLATKKKKVENKKAKLDLEFKRVAAEVDEADTAIALTQQSITNLDKDRAANLEKTAKLEARIATIDEELRAIDVPALQQALAEVQAEAKVKDQEVSEISDENEHLKNAYDAKAREADHAKRNLTEIQNYQRRIVGDMRTRYGPRGGTAAKAFKIIEEMRAEKRFQGEVHGPVISTIHAPNATFAAALEDYLGANGGCAFLTSSRADYNLINQRMQQERLRIVLSNVTMSSDVASVAEQHVQRMKTEHGVQVRGDSAFDAPALVKQYLRAFNSLERMVIGGPQTEDSIDELLRTHVPSSTRSLVVYTADARGRQMRKHEGSWSHEGKCMLNSTSNCGEARLLAAKGDDREAELKAAYQCRRVELEAMGAQLTLLNAKDKEARSAAGALRHRISGLKAKIKEPKTKAAKRKTLEKQLAEVQKRVAGDSETARANLVEELAEQSRALCGRMEALQNALHAMTALNVPCLHADLMSTAVEEALHQKQVDLDLAASAHEKIAEQRAAQAKRLKQLRKEAKRMTRELEQYAPITEKYTDEAGNACVRDTPLRARLTQLEESLEAGGIEVTIDVVQEALSAKQEALNMIQENSDVFAQYEAAQAAYADRQAQHTKRDTLNNERKAELEEARNTLRNKIVLAINLLSTNFADYMDELLFPECAVELGASEGPVATWELLIRVKFRDNSEVQTLSAHVHSGGERAVSTIMFLMALQRMTPSPFRIVDEINQGMDERNERLVMRRIIRNTTGTEGKQYFLITPKLLENLTDMENEDVVVHVVVNGRKNVRSDDWNLADFAAKRRRIAA